MSAIIHCNQVQPNDLPFGPCILPETKIFPFFTAGGKFFVFVPPEANFLHFSLLEAKFFVIFFRWR
jgi:hypothetical protein